AGRPQSRGEAMKLRHSLLAAVLTVAVAASAAFAPPASAKKKDKPADKPAAAAPGAPGDKPYGDWAKLTKDAEVHKGYFNVYRKRENLYLEIRPDQFDKPILGIFSLARGIGSNFVPGGLPVNDRLMEFQRAGDHVLVIEKNTRFTASANSPMAK